MMNFDNITGLSHALEDLFGFLREHKARKKDYRKISDLVFTSVDAIKAEFEKIQSSGLPDGDLSSITDDVRAFYKTLNSAKAEPEQEETQTAASAAPVASGASGEHRYKAHIIFQKDSKMENIRALGIVKSLEKLCSSIETMPKDLLGDHSDDEITANGFELFLVSDQPANVIASKIKEAFFLKEVHFEELTDKLDETTTPTKEEKKKKENKSDISAINAEVSHNIKQSYMSVNLSKLDALMDIVGEIVITESTVTKNPEVLKLGLDSFDKASRQLRKLTDELQDIVMAIRMIPVSATFHKMERIVRDMSNRIGKQAELVIIGEDTELDKNVIDNLSDPLMHIIRNAMDHGLETAEERIAAGKDPKGKITLEAHNSGSDVLISISDDGRGLNKDALIEKGIKKGLIKKNPAEVTDKEAYSLIFAPGFSTKEQVTEFSGRGVGMDVAMKNIEKLGGALVVDSTPGHGMSVQIRIPLTLAIIEGMQVSVGGHVFIVPLLSIRESFKPKARDITKDPDGNEMITMRGSCYPILRLHKTFSIETDVTSFEDGILIILETQTLTYCLFVDELIGEQQTVVKPLPVYISRILGSSKSIAGCTILGDGSVSLILDINGLMS
jgi:two-component system chemotaxis sensor kinase CheA